MRIKKEAKNMGANAVIGIETSIMPLMGVQEMMMIGTASTHPALKDYAEDPVTSDMTNEELWNMVNLGYMPIQLVMGVSVYSLGLTSGIMAGLQSLVGGKVEGLTEVLYEAREKALARIEAAADKCGAEDVIGIKTRVYDLGGGLVEFMVIGTAVKKFKNVDTLTKTLPPQAIIRDQETFVDSSQGGNSRLSEAKAASASRTQRGPISVILGIIFFIFYVWLKIFLHH
jgi:uncharacterized protein YbjQ (UPF0145 family)